MARTWFGEIPLCCSFTLLAPAWVLRKYVWHNIFLGPVIFTEYNPGLEHGARIGEGARVVAGGRVGEGCDAQGRLPAHPLVRQRAGRGEDLLQRRARHGIVDSCDIPYAQYGL